MSRHLVAIMLPQELAQPLREIQEQYRVPRWNERIGPHITLVRPFILAQPLVDIEKILWRIGRQHYPFEVELNGLGRFPNKDVVLYAKVEHSPSLLSLQHDLEKQMHELSQPSGPTFGDYVPHVTLSNKLTVEEADKREALMSQLPLRYKCRVWGFTLLRLQDNKWQEVKTFPLNPGK